MKPRIVLGALICVALASNCFAGHPQKRTFEKKCPRCREMVRSSTLGLTSTTVDPETPIQIVATYSVAFTCQNCGFIFSESTTETYLQTLPMQEVNRTHQPKSKVPRAIYPPRTLIPKITSPKDRG